MRLSVRLFVTIKGTRRDRNLLAGCAEVFFFLQDGSIRRNMVDGIEAFLPCFVLFP